MAFTGIHVSFHSAYKLTKDSKIPDLQIYGELVGSETSTVAGTLSTVSANDVTFARIYAATDTWVSIALNPNATTGKRMYILGLTPIDVYFPAGNRIAWAVVS